MGANKDSGDKKVKPEKDVGPERIPDPAPPRKETASIHKKDPKK